MNFSFVSSFFFSSSVFSFIIIKIISYRTSTANQSRASLRVASTFSYGAFNRLHFQAAKTKKQLYLLESGKYVIRFKNRSYQDKASSFAGGLARNKKSSLLQSLEVGLSNFVQSFSGEFYSSLHSKTRSLINIPRATQTIYFVNLQQPIHVI